MTTQATQAEELAAVGDREGAVRCYERALRLEPHNKNYKLKLDSLHHAEEQMSVLLEKLAENKGKQHFEKVDRSENSEAETPEMLCRCAERGKLPDLKGLLKAGADANAWNPLRQGDGALHYAKDVATARVLLDAGARVEAGRRSWTPLMAHVRFGRPEVAYFLLEKGADASAVVPRREPGAGRNVVFCVRGAARELISTVRDDKPLRRRGFSKDDPRRRRDAASSKDDPRRRRDPSKDDFATPTRRRRDAAATPPRSGEGRSATASRSVEG